MEEQKNHSECCCHHSSQKIIIFALILVCLTGIVVISLLRERIITSTPHEITISGEGKVFAKPDIALLRVGVRTPERMRVGDVVTENTRIMNKVIEAIKNLKVEEKDIKTVSYQLNPTYDYTENGRILRGYELTQEVEVKIRDLEKIGQIIEASTISGANQIGDVSFTIDDQDAVMAQARKQAIAKAKSKAKEMGQLTGIELGKIINVSEGSSPVPYPVYQETSMLLKGGASEAPQIETGQMEINITVSLTYEVK